MATLHPSVKQAFDPYRVMSRFGKPGTGIPLDGYTEMVCTYIR